MRPWFVACIVLFASSLDLAQGKYDANWVFGDKAGINFSDTIYPLTYISNSNNYCTAGTLSDAMGNLLFYIAPDTVSSPFDLNEYPYAIYNERNEIVANSDGLNISVSSLDGAIFLNEPQITLFYISEAPDSIDGQVVYQSFLYYTTIAKTVNGYQVTIKNHKVSNDIIEERMAVVKHANGKDWWLLVHKDAQGIPDSATNRYYKFLVTGDTVLGPFIQDIGILHSTIACRFAGMKFNRQGNMLATALADQKQVELFKFDRCTGYLSNFQLLPNVSSNDNIADCAFSPFGSKLYLLGSPVFTAIDDDGYNALYQYSIDTSAINSTRQVIWGDSIGVGFDQPFFFQSLSLAADDKIYIDVSNSSAPNYNLDSNNQYLWVISSPDSSGVSCSFKPYGFYLGDSAATYIGLPAMPNYNLGPLSTIWQSTLIGDTTICVGDTSIKGVPLLVDTVSGVSFVWQPGPGIDSDSVNVADQFVLPTQSVWYYVTFTDTSITGSCKSRTDSVYVQVMTCCDSLQLRQCTLSKDTFICTDIDTPTKGAVLFVDTVPGISFAWQTAPGIDNIHSTQQIVDPLQSTWYYVTFFSDTYYETGSCNERMDSVYVEVKKCDTLGIQEINETMHYLKIYPNPTQNVATIEWRPLNEQLQLSVSDIIGREIQSLKVDGVSGITQMDISGLANGLYIVKLYSAGGETASGKLAVIK